MSGPLVLSQLRSRVVGAACVYQTRRLPSATVLCDLGKAPSTASPHWFLVSAAERTEAGIFQPPPQLRNLFSHTDSRLIHYYRRQNNNDTCPKRCLCSGIATAAGTSRPPLSPMMMPVAVVPVSLERSSTARDDQQDEEMSTSSTETPLSPPQPYSAVTPQPLAAVTTTNLASVTTSHSYHASQQQQQLVPFTESFLLLSPEARNPATERQPSPPPPPTAEPVHPLYSSHLPLTASVCGTFIHPLEATHLTMTIGKP